MTVVQQQGAYHSEDDVQHYVQLHLSGYGVVQDRTGHSVDLIIHREVQVVQDVLIRADLLTERSL